MKAIHKFEISPGRPFHDLPAGAEILSVQEQRDYVEGYRDDYVVQMWAMVDKLSTEEYETREIRLYATGEHLLDLKQRYINTFQRHNGLVYHAFEVLE